MVVFSRNIIRSGLFMILSFAGLAGIYALLGATLVAAAEVLVYIGAISVLILFAVMLTQSKSGPARLVFHHQSWAAAIASVVLMLLLIMTVLFTTWPLAAPAPIAQSARDIATTALPRLRLRLRDHQPAAAGGGHRRHLPGAPRTGRGQR